MMPAGAAHAPTVTTGCKVTVTCAQSGAEYPVAGSFAAACTLADVEAWCAELRRQGGGDDLDLPEAQGLTVTLGRR